MNAQPFTSRFPPALGRTSYRAASGQTWQRDLAAAEQVANWLDTKFEFLGIRFGLDAIIGLIPGFGDAITSLASLSILMIAARQGVPRITQARMAANIAVDWLIGSIPLVGDLFDVAWKSNLKNAALLRRHLFATSQEQRRHRRVDWLFLGLLLGGLAVTLAASIFVAVFLLSAIWHAVTG